MHTFVYHVVCCGTWLLLLNLVMTISIAISKQRVAAAYLGSRQMSMNGYGLQEWAWQMGSVIHENYHGENGLHGHA